MAADAFVVAQADNFLSKFHMTLLFCKDSAELFLPLQGYISYEHLEDNGKKEETLIIPLTPYIAILFFTGNATKNIVFGFPFLVDAINTIGFKQQCDKEYGFIISRSEKEIKKMISSVAHV